MKRTLVEVYGDGSKAKARGIELKGKGYKNVKVYGQNEYVQVTDTRVTPPAKNYINGSSWAVVYYSS